MQALATPAHLHQGGSQKLPHFLPLLITQPRPRVFQQLTQRIALRQLRHTTAHSNRRFSSLHTWKGKRGKYTRGWSALDEGGQAHALEARVRSTSGLEQGTQGWSAQQGTDQQS